MCEERNHKDPFLTGCVLFLFFVKGGECGLNRSRRVIIALISAMISAALVYGVYMIQLKQVEIQETISVFVPQQFIDAGTRVTAEHITEKRMSKVAYDPRMVKTKDEVIGYEAIVPLAAGEPIHSWKLDRHRLMPRREESTFRIPKEYIKSIASSIRAGDQVKVYISGSEDSRLLFKETVTVAAVKSSGNTEISDDAGQHLLHTAADDYEQMYVSRRYATGAIDHINLNLSEQQWLELDRLCREEGFLLVIAYTLPAIDSVTKTRSIEPQSVKKGG